MTAATHPLRWLTLIALSEPRSLSFDALAESFARLFPAAEAPVAAGATSGMLTLTLGGYTAAITLAPRPIPAAGQPRLPAPRPPGCA